MLGSSMQMNLIPVIHWAGSGALEWICIFELALSPSGSMIHGYHQGIRLNWKASAWKKYFKKYFIAKSNTPQRLAIEVIAEVG